MQQHAQQQAAQSNAVDIEMRSAEEMREDSNESSLPLLMQSPAPSSGLPVRRYPRLRLELPDDDDDGANIAVASIFYGEGKVDVQVNLGEEDLDAVAGGNNDVDDENKRKCQQPH